MVCCALIAVLFASIFWIKRQLTIGGDNISVPPISWRLGDDHKTIEIKTPAFSIAARLKSFTYAFDGLVMMVRNEHNAWIHLVATLLILTVSLALQITLADWRWILIAVALVWFAEALNTAIEHLSNVVSDEFHEGIKATKDIAAGGVLVCSILSVLIGATTLAPYLYSPTKTLGLLMDICKTVP